MKSVFRRILVVIGACLLVAAVALLIFLQWNIHASRQQSQAYVQTLRSLIPEPESAVLEERRDNTMPVLSLDGTDFL